MLELLAAVDPISLPLWAIAIFAAGMYPVGFMLGSPCSACCKCAVCPDETTLPDTVTVTLSGFPNRTQGPDLCLPTFTSCYGSGAAGKVTEPSGDTPAGPITAVSLTNGGSGYAKLGRVAPTITASGSGTGATLTVSLTQLHDICDIDFWEVTDVSVDEAGTGYIDGEPVTFTVATGDTEDAAASATIHTLVAEPTLTATGSGTGATLNVSIEQIGTNPRWEITAITVDGGGSGYSDGEYATIGRGASDVEDSPAYAVVRTVRSAPTLAAHVTSSGGAGASLTPATTETTDGGGRAVWNVTAITVADGGSGYSVDDAVYITVTDGAATVASSFLVAVSSVDGSGSITGVTIYDGGEYLKDTGVIESVDVLAGGSYYNDTGIIESVTVHGGGAYYREDATATPYVATITIGFDQTLPSDGAGATIAAIVGDDPDNTETFGKITGLTITDGGDGYIAWVYRNTKCCGDYYDDRPIVLKRGQYGLGPCVFSHRFCGVGNLTGHMGHIAVEYKGPTEYAVVSVVSELIGVEYLGDYLQPSDMCNATLTATAYVTDCESFGFEAIAVGGLTAIVTPGGDYDEYWQNPEAANDRSHACDIFCHGDAAPPEEITASVTNCDGIADGNYVLALVQDNWSMGLAWQLDGVYVHPPWWPAEFPAPLVMGYAHCSMQGQHQWSEYEVDWLRCNTCHKRAWPTVSAGAANPFFREQNSSGDLGPVNCAACVEGPHCDPRGRSFTICNGAACDGTVTIS